MKHVQFVKIIQHLALNAPKDTFFQQALNVLQLARMDIMEMVKLIQPTQFVVNVMIFVLCAQDRILHNVKSVLQDIIYHQLRVIRVQNSVVLVMVQ